eukprot:2625524-Prymnesium_polylepis.1
MTHKIATVPPRSTDRALANPATIRVAAIPAMPHTKIGRRPIRSTSTKEPSMLPNRKAQNGRSAAAMPATPSCANIVPLKLTIALIPVMI